MNSKIAFTGLFLVIYMFGYAQTITGAYLQSGIIGPQQILRMMEKDVVISQDYNLSDKIWISNLFGDSVFYAIRNTADEDKEVYNIPPQAIAGYKINIGCLVFEREEEQIIIAINNFSDCGAISSADFGNAARSKKDIKTGLKNKEPKVPAPEIKGYNVMQVGRIAKSVKHKNLIPGLQYIGIKRTLKRNSLKLMY